MADQLQLRGGTTSEHATFTGALREVTVDTDKDTVVVHDNATVGGKPLLREDLSNLPAGTIDNADINASAAIAGTKISPNFGSQTVTTTGVISSALGAAATPSITFTGDTNTGIYSPGADQVAVSTGGTGRLFINSSGNVGIGSTNPLRSFVVSNLGAEGVEIGPGESSNETRIAHYNRSTSSWITANNIAGAHVFSTGGTANERARIDSSGRLLVGTSSALSNTYVGASAIGPAFQIEGNSGSTAALSITRQTGAAANIILQRGVTGTPVADGHAVGQINFNGFDGTNFRNAAQITAEIDGTPGTNDMPGRLVFFTTADGASSTTERMRISNGGLVTLAAGAGLSISSTGVTSPAAADGNVFSGTYTPTFTNVDNVSSSTATVCHYMRVGNVVTVGGQLSITATAANTDTQVRMTLPIASTFTSARQLGGSGGAVNPGEYGESFVFGADVTNNIAFFRGRPTVTTNQSYNFSFTYLVV